MTGEELWDKWVDPRGLLGPNDKAKELFLKDVDEMLGKGSEITFDDILKEAGDELKKKQKKGKGTWGFYGGFGP